MESKPPNYIQIINWAWDNIPFINGYSSSFMTLFLAVVDSINRNRWSPTMIPLELLLNKSGLSKPTYLKAREWLINNSLISCESGKNGYQMARFDLGIEVKKLTGINGIEVNNLTADFTSEPDIGVNNLTASLPIINKHKTVFKTIKPVNIEFDEFWNLYGKKVGLEKSRKLWEGLTDNERVQAMNHIPGYTAATPEKKYRKDPQTYLRNKSFNDEIINHERRQPDIIRDQPSGQRARL